MVDVDGALTAMRNLLGSGQPPQWPQRTFGAPVPPASTWEGDLSDTAHAASDALNRRRQTLDDAHKAVGPLVEHTAQITTTARTRLDAVIQQWHSDKQAFAPMAATPAGKLALLQLGQLRVSEAADVIRTAQTNFAGVASQLRSITAQLPTHNSSRTPQVTPADFRTDPLPQDPPPNTVIDPDHPFVGDERFGQWENYTPPPYVGTTPPPPPLEHRPLDGVPARPGGPSNFYTPGRTWLADSDAPFASQSEAYKFRINGMDATSYTRTVTINGHQQLQRWVGYTYEAQRISKVDINGSIWSKNAPGTPGTLLPGTGGIGGLGFGQNFGAWHAITPNQMANLSALNPTATYYIPDGCGGAFNFVGGVPTGGIAPPPTIPVMTAPR
jgi:hypothetical protein